MARILLIDDMQGVRSSLRVVLESAGHSVTEAIDGNEGLDKARQGGFDLVITDMMMPNADGTEVITTLRSAQPNLPVLAISGGDLSVSSDQALMLAKEMGFPILPKPFSRNDILEQVSHLTTATAEC